MSDQRTRSLERAAALDPARAHQAQLARCRMGDHGDPSLLGLRDTSGPRQTPRVDAVGWERYCPACEVVLETWPVARETGRVDHAMVTPAGQLIDMRTVTRWVWDETAPVPRGRSLIDLALSFRCVREATAPVPRGRSAAVAARAAAPRPEPRPQRAWRPPGVGGHRLP